MEGIVAMGMGGTWLHVLAYRVRVSMLNAEFPAYVVFASNISPAENHSHFQPRTIKPTQLPTCSGPSENKTSTSRPGD